jgi:hypothetical protein
MTAPARRSRADASPRKKPARSTENGHVSAAPATPAKPLQTTKSGEVSASPAGADQLGDARMVAALVLLVREMQAALRDQGGEIMLLKAQMAALLKPAAAPRAKAQAIIRAGQLRRGELPPDTQKLSPTARAIINAGRRRRNEEPI